MKGVVGSPSLNSGSSAEIVPVPGLPVTQGLEGAGAKAAVDFSCPGLGGDEHPPLSAPRALQEKAATGCSASKAAYAEPRFLVGEGKELRELGEPFLARTGRTTLLHRAGPTREHLNPAAISLHDRLGPPRSSLPHGPVFTLCFSAFCPETSAQSQAKPGEDRLSKAGC